MIIVQYIRQPINWILMTESCGVCVATRVRGLEPVRREGGCTSVISKRLVSLVQESASTHINPPWDEDVMRQIAEDRWLCLASSSRCERDLLVHFTTVVEILVIMHWRLRSKESANTACARCKGHERYSCERLRVPL